VLEAKPWKSDAVMRLILSVFVCIYSGAVLGSLLLHAKTAVKVGYPALVSIGAGAILCLLGALFFLARPWPTEKLTRRLTLLLVFFYSGVLLGAWLYKLAGPPANSAWQLVLAAVSFQGAAAKGLVLIRAGLYSNCIRLMLTSYHNVMSEEGDY
jgi:hypothetical protein